LDDFVNLLAVLSIVIIHFDLYWSVIMNYIGLLAKPLRELRGP